MDDTRSQRKNLIKAIETERKSKLVCYYLSPDNASVADDVIPPLYHTLSVIGKQPRLDVLISARGGSPEASWRVLSLLREYTDYLTIIVGYRMHSASSFIALGADEIIMTPISELAPVHIQSASPMGPVGPDDGQVWINPYDLTTYVDFAKSIGANPDEIINQFQLHPLAIGNAMRGWHLAKDVAKKCISLAKRQTTPQETERIANLFTRDINSSMMPFTRRECAFDLNLPVTTLSPSLERETGILINIYNELVTYSSPYEHDPITKLESRTITPAILESSALTIIHRRKIDKLVLPDGKVTESPGYGGWNDETVQEAL
jgi:hypothetical protein